MEELNTNPEHTHLAADTAEKKSNSTS